MRILFISDNYIFGYGGGSLGARKIFDGLKQYSDFNGAELRTITIDQPFEYSLIAEKIEKKKRDDYLSRIKGHSSYMFIVWKTIKDKVLAFNPDVVVLGRTRLGFVAKDIKRLLPNAIVICQTENIEYDYVDGYFSGRKTIARNLSVWLEKKCTYRDELMAFRYSDVVFFLSERDRVRAHELYGFNIKREIIIPVCLETRKTLDKFSNKRAVVFIGSLGYDSNSTAVTEFINDVWKQFFEKNSEVELIVGGSNPSYDLENLIGSVRNAILHKDFEDIKEIVPHASLMIAPIKQGAGMKVKVAESLSLGLIVAASDEALIGYDEALSESASEKSIVRANTVEEYVDAIENYIRMTDSELAESSVNSVELFDRYYNFSRSRRFIAEVLDWARKEIEGRKG